MIDINSAIAHIRQTEVQQTSSGALPEANVDEQVKADGAAPKATGPKPNIERTRARVAELSKAMEELDGNYSVSVDDDTGMVIVRITDTETGDIIKQVPPQQVLDADVSLDRIIGLLVNDQA